MKGRGEGRTAAAAGRLARTAAATAVLGIITIGATAQMGFREGISAAERFDFDTSHTHIGFSARHMMVTNVKGRFNRFSGHIMLDEADVTRSIVQVTIEAASVDTDNQRRDDDLRSSNFFEVERFPNITFVSKRVEHGQGGHVLVGDLTIRDVTREVEIPFELTGPIAVGNGQRRLGAEGTLRINRFDYGLTWNRITEAVQVVGPEIRIELNISAVTPRR